MGLDQRVQRAQDRRAGADLVGERRDAEIDALPGVALALPVQRLMLTELLEQDRGEQVRPGKAARRDVEGRRRLRDRLAVAARELLAHGLDHLPAARDHLQRLGDVLAELRQPAEPQHGQLVGAAMTTRSRGRCSGNGRRDGPPALERSDRRVRGRLLAPPVRPRSPPPRAPRAEAPSGRAAAPCAPSGVP